MLPPYFHLADWPEIQEAKLVVALQESREFIATVLEERQCDDVLMLLSEADIETNVVLLALDIADAELTSEERQFGQDEWARLLVLATQNRHFPRTAIPNGRLGDLIDSIESCFQRVGGTGENHGQA